MNINNIKVAPRLTIGFGIVVIIGMVIAFSAALKLQTLADGLSEVATNRMVKVGQFSDLLNNFNDIGRSARDILLSDDPAFRDGEKKKIALKRAANIELLAKLTNTVRVPRNAELLKTINDNLPTYNGAIDRAIGFAENGDRAAASGLLLGEVSTLQNIVFKAVDDSRDLQQAIADKLAGDAAQTASQGTTMMAAAAAAMLILGTLLSWLITRSITRPIGRAVTHAEAISQGDLAAHPEVQGRDEVAQLLKALGVMQGNLSGIVGRVRGGSESVSVSADPKLTS